MIAEQLTALALEVWRSHGARTETRRDSLIQCYAESYFGPRVQWQLETVDLVDRAGLLARQNTRIDELTYGGHS